MKIAWILGITGQDGSYLAEYLLAKNYVVWGTIRRTSVITTERIESIFNHKQLHLKYCDVTDMANLIGILNTIEKAADALGEQFERLEVYHLAAMSHVKISFEMPLYTAEVDALGVLRVLEILRQSRLCSRTRFYQASTSELYGNVQAVPQNETTPFYPRSPYGVAKLYGYWIVKNYREAYGMFCSNGILFNHESPRRGHNFVTQKIAQAVRNIVKGKQDVVTLGNLNAKRDWGHAKDYVHGMWLILQHDKPDDFVLATGEMHSVREFVERAFAHYDISIVWEGEGVHEIGRDKATGALRVRVDARYFRPSEVSQLKGDAKKAQTLLKWTPTWSFEELVADMLKTKVD